MAGRRGGRSKIFGSDSPDSDENDSTNRFSHLLVRSPLVMLVISEHHFSHLQIGNIKNCVIWDNLGKLHTLFRLNMYKFAFLKYLDHWTIPRKQFKRKGGCITLLINNKNYNQTKCSKIREIINVVDYTDMMRYWYSHLHHNWKVLIRLFINEKHIETNYDYNLFVKKLWT